MRLSKSIGIILIFLIVSLSPVLAASYSYDTRGNLVSGDGLYREYDSSNHLVRVHLGDDSNGMLIVNYTWHPLEERVWAKHIYFNGTLNETSFYISETFMQVVNSSGSYNLTYVYQQKDLIGFSENRNQDWNLLDHKGSSTGVMNRSGAVIETTQYEPYGKIISGGATSKLDYEGEENDPTTGMIDFDARMVDPELGMFMQPDTLIQNVYDPQSLNHYTFERNNPYRRIEVDGRYSKDIHYDVTYDAAIAGGFSQTDAAVIASANVNTDENLKTSPLNPFATMKYHYASREDAEARLADAIEAGDLQAFGQAMHTYQDTYSHSGENPFTHSFKTLTSSKFFNAPYSPSLNPDNPQSKPGNYQVMVQNTALYTQIFSASQNSGAGFSSGDVRTLLSGGSIKSGGSSYKIQATPKGGKELVKVTPIRSSSSRRRSK